MHKIGKNVYGSNQNELEDFLRTKHSNLERVTHDFQQRLKVWKGRRKKNGSKVLIVSVIDSGVVFYSVREGIKDLTSFLYGVCCSFSTIDGLVEGITSDHEDGLFVAKTGEGKTRLSSNYSDEEVH